MIDEACVDLSYESLRKRAGRVRCSWPAMKVDLSAAMSVMSRCVVLRAEHLAYTNEIEYLVFSPDLPKIEDYCEAPKYEVIIKDGKFLRFDPTPSRHAP